MNIDFSALTFIREMRGENPEDTLMLKSMADEAQRYLLSFSWCKQIKTVWFGWGIGGICAVFLFEILPAATNVDSWLWVVLGDLPSAYLVVDECPGPIEALNTYIELMQEWVDAVHEGKPTDGCIPVNAPPTAENADLLERRLTFLKEKLLV
jgi:hypothetical protein